MTEVVQHNSPGVNAAFPSLAAILSPFAGSPPTEGKNGGHTQSCGMVRIQQTHTLPSCRISAESGRSSSVVCKLEGKIKNYRNQHFSVEVRQKKDFVSFVLHSLKRTCQTPSVSLSTELRPCPSSCGLPHKDYKDRRRGEPNKQVLFSAPMRESRGH